MTSIRPFKVKVGSRDIDGGNYSSPGKVWVDEREYQCRKETEEAWSVLQRRIACTKAPDHTSEEDVRFAASRLGLPLWCVTVSSSPLTMTMSLNPGIIYESVSTARTVGTDYTVRTMAARILAPIAGFDRHLSISFKRLENRPIIEAGGSDMDTIDTNNVFIRKRDGKEFVVEYLDGRWTGLVSQDGKRRDRVKHVKGDMYYSTDLDSFYFRRLP